MLIIEADSDYEYGRKVGRTNERLYRRILNRTRPLEGETLRSRSSALSERYPEALERMEGISRSLGADIDSVIAAASGRTSSVSGCTNFAAVPPATRDEQVCLSWNLDLPRFFRTMMGRFPFYVRKIRGYNPYLCLNHSFVGLPYCFGLGVMNSEGLCSIYNAVGMTDGGGGLTFIELNNMWMERCSTVEGAVEVLESNPREIAAGITAVLLLNPNWLIADRHGRAALVEASHNYIEVTDAGDHEGILASTNHHQFLDRAKTGSPDPASQPMITGSYARLARMWDLLRQYHGRIDPEVVQVMKSDHGVNYECLREYGIDRAWYGDRIEDSTICAHPWNFWKHVLRGEFEQAYMEAFISRTIYGILLDPKKCTMWFHPGNPCRNTFLPYWLGDVMEMPHAGEAREMLDYVPEQDLDWKYEADRGRVFTRPLSDSRFGRAVRDLLYSAVKMVEAHYEGHTDEPGSG